MQKTNILVGCTGSVASIKIHLLLEKLNEEFHCNLRLVATDKANHFFESHTIRKDVEYFSDADEWDSWKSIGDPVLHIELRKWADILLIAPCDANTLGKMANGLCDNLLTCTIRAWDITKPLIYCPAMNSAMWHHPITLKHLETVNEFGYKQCGPIAKRLACGDVGLGAMSEVSDIVMFLKSFI